MLSQIGRRERIGVYGLIVLFLFAAGYVGGKRLQQPQAIVIESVNRPNIDQGEGKPKLQATTPVISAKTLKPTELTEVVVDVTGAVRNPGVHHLIDGDRVEKAIIASGGVTADADIESVNLAAKVDDGQMVHVPRKGEDRPPATFDSKPRKGRSHTSQKKSKVTSGSVSLNSATAEELETVPGIGPSTAQKIVAYRQEHGGFSSIEDLEAIPGFGAKRIERIAKWLRL